MRRTLLIAFGIAGCGAEATPKMSVNESLAQSYEKLQSLQIFSAGQLILNLPEEATSCYGIPCPGSNWQKPYDDERARQASRLAKLTELAQQMNGQYDQPHHELSEASAATAALQALQIIEVYDLVTVQPQNNPECYNLPCESDRLAAEEATRSNVDRAFAIAEAAKKSGL